MIVGPQDILNFSEGVLVAILQTTYCHLHIPHATNCAPVAIHMHALYTLPCNITTCMYIVYVCTCVCPCYLCRGPYLQSPSAESCV